MQSDWAKITANIKFMVCLAFADFTDELRAEFEFHKIKIIDQQGRLFLIEPLPRKPVWAQDMWLNCSVVKIDSISDAAKAIGHVNKRSWGFHQSNHRRAELIQEKLFRYANKPIPFLSAIESKKWGVWSLITPNTLLICEKSMHALPDAEIQFQENKTDAPSRAYLKLWEFFTLHSSPPQSGEKVLDLGSSPGGWTWVLDQLGCKVLSIDKAPLDVKLMQSSNIQYLKKDVFQLTPQEIGPVEWLFSDMICYQQKLLDYLVTWQSSGLCKNFVCTIKYQGETDWQTTEKFLKMLGGQIVHLQNNKHEVTWFKLAGSEKASG